MKRDGAIWALGTMSGTSLDGVDAAMIHTDGHDVLAFGPSDYRPYSASERAVLRAALGRWPGEAGVAEAAEVIEIAHAEILARFQGAEIVGFHGQTLAHDPANRRTHQAGDGSLISEALGLPVVWQFRDADVRLGGQGAPLAPFYHHALARRIGAQAPVAFLNLGGVGNLTWTDPRIPRPEKACVAFDTGPANAPIDDLVASRRGLAFDEGGALARSGTVDGGIIAAFLDDPYFLRMPPKSLDRNGFPALIDAVSALGDADAAATLTEAVVASVLDGLRHCPEPPRRLLVTGGGRKNSVIMEGLAARAGCRVQPVEAAGLDGDMIEAQAFAYLAVRVARGLPTSCSRTTGVAAAIGGGVFTRPETV
ncbi:anhydro-N-acetylmuramic acid kinase [Anianabacter salinae]|uniref:anhydro-N-acetylmuramic acid kinase n=1 Tax=Anianabacter salinae TaxID=2851023 RepID=UPI00225DD1DC|nr:anhydro-N-acetylmuramic acid kinase [Anianabacter salinae]MBV0912970.1 anhydro-N-acetylmuramic acid kinase [Anianabacter salinae]